MVDVKYGTPILVHDGAGHFRGGIVFATRTDLGGPGDPPTVSGVTLDPKFITAGQQRGNPVDAVVTFHDLPYLDVAKSADAVRAGWTDLGEVFHGEELAGPPVKKVVLPAPVVIAPPPVPVEPAAAPVPTAIVGGVRVETDPSQVPGVEYVAVAPAAEVPTHEEDHANEPPPAEHQG